MGHLDEGTTGGVTGPSRHFRPGSQLVCRDVYHPGVLRKGFTGSTPRGS